MPTRSSFPRPPSRGARSRLGVTAATLAALALALLTPASASAQVRSPYVPGPEARAQADYYEIQRPAPSNDDVAWETRREPWDGGPVRPGAELEGHWGPLLVPGAIGLIAGYAISFVGVIERPIAVVPFVGPWLALANVDQVAVNEWGGLQDVAMVVAGILQPVGLVGLVLGLALPEWTVIYDAPVAVLPEVGPGYAGLRAGGAF